MQSGSKKDSKTKQTKKESKQKLGQRRQSRADSTADSDIIITANQPVIDIQASAPPPNMQFTLFFSIKRP